MPVNVICTGPVSFLEYDFNNVSDRKFGKQLQRRQLDIPEYAASFVNYKALKKLIKQLSATPVLNAQNASQILDTQATLQANKATFFFRLERELEKVNAFYLQKEAELKLRLKTLLDKKKVAEAKHRAASKLSANFVSLEEGFQSFGNDLNKLQQFVEINATAFSKILKKWDKTSKSRTKELYLSRAVEVQPCFNREVISELSDQATTSLLELGAWAEGEKIDFTSRKPNEYVLHGQVLGTEDNDTDSELQQAATSGNLQVLKDWTQRLVQAPDASARLTRAFLASVAEASIEAIEVLLATGLIDVHVEDAINERNCLHEAAISGRDQILQIGLKYGVDPSRIDVYGRLPLHYACIYGHASMIQQLVAVQPATINDPDHDSYTPLIHCIVRHQLKCVHQLLGSGARIDPSTENEHAPLNLACQHGELQICKLLLEKGATLTTDAEGLYPQHLVARKGHNPQLLLLLEEYGADLNQQDKLYQWTPLFHAASEGVVECVKILLDKGADIDILDEKYLPAVYYAAWEGHLQCMKLLNQAARIATRTLRGTAELVRPHTSSTTPMHSADSQADGIPDLSLPPPIIPFRRYGHNFLDSKTFVQLTFDINGSEAIRFFNDSKYPAARLTVSSKSPDYIPRNVMIPIQEEFRVVTFQVDKLDMFSIDFDIYPSFGSKVIARTVVLPDIFQTRSNGSDRCVLPLFDPRLRAIGRLCFSFQVIRPFEGIPLEISQFDTYWKATSQLDTSPSTFITGSSLSGEYVQLFVQLTRDGIPVIRQRLDIDDHGINYPVCQLTYKEFSCLIEQSSIKSLSTNPNLTPAQMEKQIAPAKGFQTLQETLDEMSPSVRVMLQVVYPLPAEYDRFNSLLLDDVNTFVDAILTVVFDHARRMRANSPDLLRSLVFASFNPSVCLALNWKQPNYPVFLCSNLDTNREDPVEFTLPMSASHKYQSLSIKEAVRIAQSNNLMGLICKSALLKTVPQLVHSVKVAGLVLVSETTEDPDTMVDNSDEIRDSLIDGVDGILYGSGILRFTGAIDV